LWELELYLLSYVGGVALTAFRADRIARLVLHVLGRNIRDPSLSCFLFFMIPVPDSVEGYSHSLFCLLPLGICRDNQVSLYLLRRGICSISRRPTGWQRLAAGSAL
jgi:hypothetical protein